MEGCGVGNGGNASSVSSEVAVDLSGGGSNGGSVVPGTAGLSVCPSEESLKSNPSLKIESLKMEAEPDQHSQQPHTQQQQQQQQHGRIHMNLVGHHHHHAHHHGSLRRKRKRKRRALNGGSSAVGGKADVFSSSSSSSSSSEEDADETTDKPPAAQPRPNQPHQHLQNSPSPQPQQQPQPIQQPEGWRVKLYRLNADGSWDDCGTGRILCLFHPKEDPPLPTPPPLTPAEQILYKHLGEPTLCMHAEIPQHASNALPKPHPRLLLRTRVLLRDAYQRQGDNIITWCEPFFPAHKHNHPHHQQQMDKEQRQDEGVDLALSFQDNAGCLDIWRQITTIQSKASEWFRSRGLFNPNPDTQTANTPANTDAAVSQLHDAQTPLSDVVSPHVMHHHHPHHAHTDVVPPHNAAHFTQNQTPENTANSPPETNVTHTDQQTPNTANTPTATAPRGETLSDMAHAVAAAHHATLQQQQQQAMWVNVASEAAANASPHHHPHAHHPHHHAPHQPQQQGAIAPASADINNAPATPDANHNNANNATTQEQPGVPHPPHHHPQQQHNQPPHHHHHHAAAAAAHHAATAAAAQAAAHHHVAAAIAFDHDEDDEHEFREADAEAAAVSMAAAAAAAYGTPTPPTAAASNNNSNATPSNTSGTTLHVVGTATPGGDNTAVVANISQGGTAPAGNINNNAGQQPQNANNNTAANNANSTNAQLPNPPTLNTLEEIADIIAAAQMQQRENLSLFISQSDCAYLKSLLSLFPSAEAKDDYRSLATLAACVKAILLLNDPSIIEIIANDGQVFENVCSALEYDPDLRDKANHRWFIRERAKFRTVVKMEDEDLVSTIHRSFRVTYLRDTLLRPTMDESSLSTLASLLTFTHAEVVKGVMCAPPSSQQQQQQQQHDDDLDQSKQTTNDDDHHPDSYLVQVLRMLGREVKAIRKMEWEQVETSMVAGLPPPRPPQQHNLLSSALLTMSSPSLSSPETTLMAKGGNANLQQHQQQTRSPSPLLVPSSSSSPSASALDEETRETTAKSPLSTTPGGVSPNVSASPLKKKPQSTFPNASPVPSSSASPMSPSSIPSSSWKQHLAPQDASLPSRKLRRRGCLSFLRELFNMVRMSLQQSDKDDFYAMIVLMDVDVHHFGDVKNSHHNHGKEGDHSRKDQDEQGRRQKGDNDVDDETTVNAVTQVECVVNPDEDMDEVPVPIHAQAAAGPAREPGSNAGGQSSVTGGVNRTDLESKQPSTPSNLRHDTVDLLALLGAVLSDPNTDVSERGASLEILSSIAMHDPSLIRRHCLDELAASKEARESTLGAASKGGGTAAADYDGGRGIASTDKDIAIPCRPEPNDRRQVIFNCPPNDLLLSLLYIMAVETDAGLLLQTSEIIRIILDTEMMGEQGPLGGGLGCVDDEDELGGGHAPGGAGGGGSIMAGMGVQPGGAGGVHGASEQNSFLSMFYEHYVQWLVAPFQYTLLRPLTAFPLAGPAFQSSNASADQPASKTHNNIVQQIKQWFKTHKWGGETSKGIGGLLRLVPPCAIRTSFAVELLSFCVRAHCYRMKFYVLRSRVLGNVLKLLNPVPSSSISSGDRCLKLAALRFLRSVLSVKDEFYHRHIIQYNLFAPVFEAFRANPVGDNLVSSAIIEMCDFIRTENIKSLVEYIVMKHLSHPQTHDNAKSDLCSPGKQLPSLEDVATPYVDTLSQLRKKHEENVNASKGGAKATDTSDMCLENGHHSSGYFDDSPSGRSPRVVMSQKALEDQRKFRETDEEESYFNDDDDDDEEEERIPPRPTSPIPLGAATSHGTVIGDTQDSEMQRARQFLGLCSAPPMLDPTVSAAPSLSDTGPNAVQKSTGAGTAPIASIQLRMTASSDDDEDDEVVAQMEVTPACCGPTAGATTTVSGEVASIEKQQQQPIAAGDNKPSDD